MILISRYVERHPTLGLHAYYTLISLWFSTSRENIFGGVPTLCIQKCWPHRQRTAAERDIQYYQSNIGMVDLVFFSIHNSFYSCEDRNINSSKRCSVILKWKYHLC